MASLSIGWLLVGDERVASARLQGWLVHRGLLKRGHRSAVLNEPGAFDTRLRWKAPRRWREALLRRRDVLVFQKVESSRAVRLASLARRVGTRIVVAESDPRENPLYGLAHRVVASSDVLADRLRSQGVRDVVTIPDALEHDRDAVAPGSERTHGLRLVWIGHRFNFPALAPLRRVLGRPGLDDLELVTVSDHGEADHRWSPERALREMLRADVAVLPCEDTEASRAKSNNRLSLFMGVGLPTVATPLPSYEAAASSGRDVIFARSEDEWARALDGLRDPSARRRLGAAARDSAWERFAPASIVARWEKTLLDLVAPGARPMEPARTEERAG